MSLFKLLARILKLRARFDRVIVLSIHRRNTTPSRWPSGLPSRTYYSPRHPTPEQHPASGEIAVRNLILRTTNGFGSHNQEA